MINARVLCCVDHLLQVLRWLGLHYPELRAQLARVQVQVKPRPDALDRARGASEQLRGYYWGPEPAELRDDGTGAAICADQLVRQPGEQGPDAIVLFADRIEPLTRQEVAKTLMHELGHLVGFDEWELTEGLGLQ